MQILNSFEENVLVWLGFSSALYFMAFRFVSVKFPEAQIWNSWSAMFIDKFLLILVISLTCKMLCKLREPSSFKINTQQIYLALALFFLPNPISASFW